jgi:hypothetical protein
MRQPPRRRLFELLAAMGRGDGNASPPRPWESPELWQALLPLADFHDMTTALPGALKTLGIWEDLPGDVAALLSALHELNLARRSGLRAQGLQVLATLDQAGIAALPLKGLAYEIIGLYSDDPAQRLTRDIDVLVDEPAADDAQEVLVAAGYRPDPAPRIRQSDHHLVELIPNLETHGPAAVEIHVRLGRREHTALVPPAAVLASAQAVETDGRVLRVPRISDLVDHAVVHSGLQQSQAARRTLKLREAFDISRLWQRAGTGGYGIRDLRIGQDKSALAHFGACLILTGTPPQELGSLAGSARRWLKQVLLRQSIAERVILEKALIRDVKLLRENPRAFFLRLTEARRYRTLMRLLSSGST